MFNDASGNNKLLGRLKPIKQLKTAERMVIPRSGSYTMPLFVGRHGDTWGARGGLHTDIGLRSGICIFEWSGPVLAGQLACLL